MSTQIGKLHTAISLAESAPPHATRSITIRVSPDKYSEYKSRAVDRGVSISAIVRGCLDNNIGRLRVPPQVPAVNRSVWADLRVATEDLHAAIAALRTGRSEDLDDMVRTAACSFGDLVRELRHLRESRGCAGEAPDDLILVVERALADAQAISMCLAGLLAMRIEELDMDEVLRVGTTAETLLRKISEMSCALLGKVSSTNEPT
jgi:hypothetical protein